MDFNFLTQSLSEICNHSLVSPGRPLDCTIIVNPAGGGFTIGSKWKSHIKTLTAYGQKARENPQRILSKNVNTILTEGKGSAGNITKTLIDEAGKKTDSFYLIISAGGDGNHCEIMR